MNSALSTFSWGEVYSLFPAIAADAFPIFHRRSHLLHWRHVALRAHPCRAMVSARAPVNSA